MLLAICAGVQVNAEEVATVISRISFTETSQMYCSKIAVTDEVGTYTYNFDFSGNENLSSGTREIASAEDPNVKMTLNATSGTFRFQGGYGFQVAQNNYVEFPTEGEFSAVVTISYAGDANGVLVLSRDGSECDTANPAKSGSATEYTLSYTEPSGDPEQVETTLIKTSFADWTESVISDNAMEVTSKTLTTKKTKEEITFSLTGCSVYPNAGGKVSAMSDGYLCAMKQNGTNNATIETSVFASVTTVSYFHQATGNSRGWGLQAKGDGDDDWVTVYSTVTDSKGAKVVATVNKTNVQLRWYNLSSGNYAALSNLEVKGMYIPAVRTFKDFEIDLSVNPVAPLPEGVTQVSYPQNGVNFHGSQHGWQWYAIRFAVDGPVKISLGGCQFANTIASVEDKDGNVLGSIDTKSAGCPQGNGMPYATWTYNVEEANTLTVYCGEYCPAIKVEKCEFVEDVEIEYYDQNKVKLGSTTVAPDAPLAFAYGESDLTIAEGQAFRGWYLGTGKRVEANTLPGESLKLYAKVTAIETVAVGTILRYDFTDQNFHVDEHECLTLSGSNKWNDKQHGWAFNAGSSLTVPVAGKALVDLGGLCQYSKSDAVITVTTKNGGTEVASFPAYNASCGNRSFFYNGEADELVFTFSNTSYVSKLDVYNVEQELVKDETTGYYMVSSGDAASLVLALIQLQDGEKIFLPNGTYDLGEAILTTISASNVSIIGQSMEGVIIKNWVPAENESIDKTATIRITGSNVYLQDLTLQNTLDYYLKNNGRAVALWDKGTHTICKNVRLLSYQDTYYSNQPGMVSYFEGGSIHGTVDFLCGEGTVYFKEVELYCEKRNSSGGGSDCITANSAKIESGDKGYILESCTIKSECPVVSLGRAWSNQSTTVFLNTILDYSAGNFTFEDEKIKRWTLSGINVNPTICGEYNTKTTDGTVVSPASNVVTFTKNGNLELETILTDEQAAEYDYTTILGSWNPAAEAAQEALQYTIEGGNMIWDETEATVFLKETSTGVEIVTSLPMVVEEGVTYRAANARGGFGSVAVEKGTSTAIGSIASDSASKGARKYIENGRVVIEKEGVKFDVMGKRL